MSESQTGRAIEAVGFDGGRVLYRWDLRILFEQLIEDEERLEFLLSEDVTEQWHFQHDAGRPLGDMVPERQAQFPDYADALNAYRTRFNETIPGPVPGSLEIVRELHEGDVPLYAITNFGAEFWDGFRPTAPIFDLFRDIVVSGKERIAKPDERIFALAAQRFRHDPDKMFFIDDNAANIAAARALGWQVHHFLDASRLRNDLEARGLLPPE